MKKMSLLCNVLSKKSAVDQQAIFGKKPLLDTLIFTKKFFIIAILGLLFSVNASSQFVASWALTSNKDVTSVTDVQAANVTAGTMIPGTNFPNPGSHNTDGYRCAITAGTWPTVATDGDNIDFPLSPASGFDLTISSITFTAKMSGSSGSSMASLAYQVDGTGPWVAFGTPQAMPGGGTRSITFSGLNATFFNGFPHILRLYVYGDGTPTSSRSVTIKNFVVNGTTVLAGTPPTVTTDSARATGKYTATGYGTITAGTINIISSGVCWGTDPNPLAVAPFTNNAGPLTSGIIGNSMGGDISGLSAGTTYHVRTFVTTLAGTVYGADITFTTDAASEPFLITKDPHTLMIAARTATSGGIITDSGGVAITAKGVCWSTSPTPTLADSKSSDGTGGTDYNSSLINLLPNTLYYVRAYAINSVDTGYGNIESFTTLPQSTEIIVFPSPLNFGNVILNTLSASMSFNVSGYVLSPAAGDITIQAPEGFQISSNTSSGFSNSLTVPYTAGSLASTVIYVRFSPTRFGSFYGDISISGGTAASQNVAVTGIGVQSPADFSNKGTDFWVGYGFQSLMTSSNNQDMVLYLSSDQLDTVLVEIPGIGYPAQEYIVQPNVALATNPLPKGAPFDARLNSTGVLPRAIHIYSKNHVPTAVWAHIYASQSSGASLVLPTYTWGTDYTVLTVGGQTNSGVPHSFFFVMADQDNTVIDITPAADITATTGGTTALYPADVPFSITLNKGEVFNALGKLISSSVGSDLTGSRITSRDCTQKIAVFTGNGRVQLSVGGCSFTDGGSDNFIQQILPRVAWGTKYLTTPFRDMEAGMYRVVVQDTATDVTVNGQVLDHSLLLPVTSPNKFYYEIINDTPNAIISSKPVMVAQFCATHSCNGTGIDTHPNTGPTGDPEMVILSPVQQAIKDVTVFSATNYAIVNNYINVIIKKEGVDSFQFDGVSASAEFIQHAQDSGYFYAVFDSLQGGISHHLTSNIPFNAIAYGFTGTSNNESYGYNAGTQVQDLTAPLIIANPYGPPVNSATQALTTCRGNTVKLSATLPYETNNIKFGFFNNPHISPNADVTLHANTGNLPYDSTFDVNGQTFYVYKLTTGYTFDSIGTYTLQVTSFNPTSNGSCSAGTDKTINYSINVITGIKPDFAINYNSCLNDSVKLTDQTNGAGYEVTGWRWSYNNGSLALSHPNDTIPNPAIVNPADNTERNFTLRVINSLGCFSDTTKPLLGTPPPNVTFTALAGVCTNTAAFALTGGSPATVGGVGTGVYSGTGVTGGNFDPSVAGAGTHTITYTYTTAANCSAFKTQTIVVSQAAILSIANVGPLCANGDAVTLVPNLAGGVFSGTAVTGDSFDPSQAGVGNFTVSYSIPTNTCTVAGSLPIVVNALPTVDAGTQPVSIGRQITLTGTADAGTYLWTAIPTTNITNPTSLISHSSPDKTTMFTLTATSSAGCKNSDSVEVVVIPKCVDPGNLFTPNSDGSFDTWKVTTGDCTKNVQVNVYNRWGGLVYHSNNYINDWDGRHNGHTLPDATYYYVIRITMVDNSVSILKGNVTIMR
jgi:gliding motility-associated-like protein